jgi:hypothetical protein
MPTTTKTPTSPTAAEAVAAALADHPGSSAAELSEIAGVGQSTATKTLATLEADGRASRLPGGRADNGRRQPDRWNPLPTAPTQTAARAAKLVQPASDNSESAGRLGRGELAGLVADFMAAHRGEAVGPTAVAKALGRSSGAVANALGRLTEAGTVALVGDQPRRYRLARG